MTKPDPEVLARLRVRCAELAGAKNAAVGCRNAYWPVSRFPWLDQIEGRLVLASVPNYPEDLNATHALEQALITTHELRCEFIAQLWKLLELPNNTAFWTEQNFDSFYEVSTAEAWQRCVAIDRTLSEEPIV